MKKGLIRVWVIDAIHFLLRVYGRITGSLSSLPIVRAVVTHEVSGGFVKQSIVGQVNISVPNVGYYFEKNPQTSHNCTVAMLSPQKSVRKQMFVLASIKLGYSGIVLERRD